MMTALIPDRYSRRAGAVATRAMILSVIVLIAGCSTLPRDGPSQSAVEAGGDQAGEASYAIVPLDYAASERIKAAPARFLGSLVTADSGAVSGLIGVGDTLEISVLEPSGRLFGSGSSTTTVRSGTQALPPVVVDRDGSVPVPFAGTVSVSGLSPNQAASAIRRALIGKVGNPQVIVSISENASNTVTVLGEVKQPGRAPLSINADRILDVIAETGGASRPVEDIVVTIQRGVTRFDAPLSAVTTTFEENVRLARGDQVNLVYTPRRYSTFGALGAVSQVDIPAGEFTLAGALSKVGGLDTNSANARSVLVFRFERPEVAQALGITQAPTIRGVPVVYRLDLEQAAGFFTASNFEMMPEDIVYVPRSSSAELSKFFTLIQTVTRVVYDVSVTSALNLD